MNISGVHMNYSFTQKLKERHSEGEDLGSATSLLENSPGMRLGQVAEVNPAKDGLTPAATALENAPAQVAKTATSETEELTLGQTFANEIIRRMGEITDENGEVKDSSGLQDSLADTMDWVREKFGDETAAAAVGMILQATSTGVNEDTLGEGMLNVLKFIDRNFGVNAGDSVMAEFNSGINAALNNFFDNGQNEIFYDAGAVTNEDTAAQDISARFFAQAVQSEDDAASSFEELQNILEKLKEELDNVAELQDLTTQLENNFNPANADMAAALDAYQLSPNFIEPEFLDIMA